ncbi:elongation of very long chain fatty acids protein AAEL008004-like [Chrysoperla carnea]|uniref:elongation of very long chain fatty acids protein AAEL008004-like n=1 Tax=Chrysoperla carnea TaxID=189513 RepID=UPI001D071AC0|nr:elongation of very long chain fatty acids protein AAEL008004-like [Chrysoperla carnea]
MSTLSIRPAVFQKFVDPKPNKTMAGFVKMAIDRYVDVFDSYSDPRTAHWPMMQSPFPSLLLVATYLYFVTFLGPRIMANRKPFKLTKILLVYNIFQVVMSAIMVYEHFMAGWAVGYSYVCQPVDYSNSQQALRMANLCWWYYMSKLSEFADTIFFVLRKKDSQITWLHLYHHSITPLETWICVKFIPGGHGTFGNLLNNIVHVIMYAYYLVAAMGPQYQKYLWWKKYLTSIQLLQFALVFVHSAQLLWFDCGYPRILGPLLIIHSVIFFALFSNFYAKKYVPPAEKTVKQH